MTLRPDLAVIAAHVPEGARARIEDAVRALGDQGVARRGPGAGPAQLTACPSCWAARG